MKKEDLIKKLEETSFPEIEAPSHKERLKRSLIENYFQTKKKEETFIILRKFAFATLSLIVLVFVSFYLIIPEYTLAKAERIVLANDQVKEFIEQGSILKEIKVIENKGYALISSIKEGELLKIDQEGFAGILVEIDLKEERVSKINKISPSIFLDEKEEKRAKEIAEENPEIKKNIPQEAEILEIRSIPSELRLIQKGKEIEVSPKEKKATIIYELDEKKWEGKIDLIEEKVENVEFLSKDVETDKDIETPTTTKEKKLEIPTKEISPVPSVTPYEVK